MRWLMWGVAVGEARRLAVCWRHVARVIIYSLFAIAILFSSDSFPLWLSSVSFLRVFCDIWDVTHMHIFVHLSLSLFWFVVFDIGLTWVMFFERHMWTFLFFSVFLSCFVSVDIRFTCGGGNVFSNGFYFPKLFSCKINCKNKKTYEMTSIKKSYDLKYQRL